MLYAWSALTHTPYCHLVTSNWRGLIWPDCWKACLTSTIKSSPNPVLPIKWTKITQALPSGSLRLVKDAGTIEIAQIDIKLQLWHKGEAHSALRSWNKVPELWGKGEAVQDDGGPRMNSPTFVGQKEGHEEEHLQDWGSEGQGVQGRCC